MRIFLDGSRAKENARNLGQKCSLKGYFRAENLSMNFEFFDQRFLYWQYLLTFLLC